MKTSNSYLPVNRKLIRTLNLVFAIILFTTSVTVQVSSISDLYADEEANSVAVYTTLMDKMRDEIGQICYPENYCGAYIDEFGQLIILANKSYSDNLTWLDCVTGSDYQIVYGKYASINEMKHYESDILEKYQVYYDSYQDNPDTVNDDLKQLLFDFTGAGISESDNKLVIAFSEKSRKNLSLFREYFSDYKNIEFEECPHYELSSVRLGDQIRNCGDIYNYTAASVGYRSYYTKNGVTYYGFTTAGHFANDLLNMSVYHYATGSFLGEIKVSTSGAGNVDAAFVSLGQTSAINFTNTTQAGHVLTGAWFTSIPEGMTVYMSGHMNPTASGTVSNNSFNFTIDGVLHTDMVRANYNSSDGDSGGIVYGRSGTAYCVAGIHTARLGIVYLNNKAVFTKASNIYSVMNIIPY